MLAGRTAECYNRAKQQKILTYKIKYKGKLDEDSKKARKVSMDTLDCQ
jgi:hypothetical protein